MGCSHSVCLWLLLGERCGSRCQSRCRLAWCTRHAALARRGFAAGAGACCAEGMLAGRCRLLCAVYPASAATDSVHLLLLLCAMAAFVLLLMPLVHFARCYIALLHTMQAIHTLSPGVGAHNICYWPACCPLWSHTGDVRTQCTHPVIRYTRKRR